MGLTNRQSDMVQTYSGGMKRKLEIAKALLHNPKVLLLDEPDTGLDPGARRDVWNMLQKLRDENDMTIVLTTHLMDEADRCDRIAIINEGQLIALDSPVQLKAQIGGDVITLATQDIEDTENCCLDITNKFSPWDLSKKPRIVHNRIYIERDNGMDFIAELAKTYANRIASMSIGTPTLEDVFLHLTGHTLYDK